MTSELTVQPGQVLALLAAGLPAQDGAGERVAVCDGVPVAKVHAAGGVWAATHVACDHPCHGAHPRYRAAYERLRQRFQSMLPQPTGASACPKCAGEGWIAIDAPEARKLILMAATFNMFKGVPLGDGTTGLKQDHVRDTMAMFLAGSTSGGEVKE